MELKTYLTIILRRWWVILLVTLAVGGASVFASKWLPPKYQAKASLRVTTPIIGSAGDINYQTYYADRLMNTYSEIAASEQVMNEVKSAFKLEKSPDITVTTVPNSEIIQITVNDPDAQLATNIANKLATIIIARGQENASSNMVDPGNLSILTERRNSLQKELDQAKADYQKLVDEYAKTSSQLAVLDRTIQTKETAFQNLQDQRQQAIINEAVAQYQSTKVPATTTKNILTESIDQAATELVSLRMQSEELSANSAKYSQELVVAGQTVQTKESAYSNLLSQMDAARIVNMKQESAQDVLIASPAVVPLKPTGLTKPLIVGIGVLCGLIIGVLLAFFLDSLDNRIRTTEQVQQLTDLPILSRVPKLSAADRRAPFESQVDNVQRAYWTLCTKLLILQQSKQMKTILVTSPNPGEGKSTILLGIATGLARANRKVLIVDADLRQPRQHELLKVSNERGLGNFLRGEIALEKVIQTIDKPGIHFLPSGPTMDEPVDLFHAPLFATLLEKIAAYDVVLFDSPALLAVPDAYDLAIHMDAAILVVQQKRTTVEDVRSAISQLEDVNGKLLGTIINRIPGKKISGYYRRASRLQKAPEPRTVQS